jgi:hypothetical protein
MEKLITEKGKSYWDDNGAYQNEYDKLNKELVPASGEADTVHGEMIRAIGRLFYDFCNNGNCNVLDVEREDCDECGGSGYEDEEYDHCCYDCDGDGEINEDECDSCSGDGYVTEAETKDCGWCGGDCQVDGDIIITDYYGDMIGFLHAHLKNDVPVDSLEHFLKRTDIGYSSYTFVDDEMKVYNDLCDEVIHQVLTTDNKDR